MSDVERIKKRFEKHSYTETQDDMNPYPPNKVISLKTCFSIVDEELAKEPQECKWTKGINSVETCWGDIDIKTFNIFKRQGAKFCPYCGRKISNLM